MWATGLPRCPVSTWNAIPWGRPPRLTVGREYVIISRFSQWVRGAAKRHHGVMRCDGEGHPNIDGRRFGDCDVRRARAGAGDAGAQPDAGVVGAAVQADGPGADQPVVAA